MESYRFVYKNSGISYHRFGSGPDLVLCFHGYGEDAAVYTFLEKYAGNQFTFYSIDLPFHGKTEWNEGLLFTHNDLQQIVKGILFQNNLKLQSPNLKLSLLGFSLGGRVILSLFQMIPDKIKRIVLLAPDGLKINFWYWLSTQTWIGNRLFAFTMKNPGWFFGFLKMLNRLRLVNASVFKFVRYYIENSKFRKLLYQRWTCLRKIKPQLPLIRSLIKRQNTDVRLIYGKHDRIILPLVGKRFISGIEEQSILSVINSGHQVLHEKHVKEILPALLQ